MEVVEDQLLVDAGGLRDPLDPGPGEPVAGEFGACRGENGVPTPAQSHRVTSQPDGWLQ